MSEQLNRLSEVERELTVTRETLYRWIASGKLRAWKIGSQYRVPESEVARFSRPGPVVRRSHRP